ncbi:MAG: aminoacyl-tRNA hydrolase [Candidatus Saccharimonadales bacterium]
MALFQKKTTETTAPLYSLGQNRTVLIIGLGNPGQKHQADRHNVGFMVLDYFAKQHGFAGWLAKKDLKAQVSIANMGDVRVILARPDTFMNSSGQAVSALQRFYRIYNPQLLVVYDELALPFGQVRTRLGGSDAGHNGVKSLIGHIGEDFWRLRAGIASELAQKTDSANFVLDKFTKEENDKLPDIFKATDLLIDRFISSGELAAETQFVA